MKLLISLYRYASLLLFFALNGSWRIILRRFVNSSFPMFFPRFKKCFPYILCCFSDSANVSHPTDVFNALRISLISLFQNSWACSATALAVVFISLFILLSLLVVVIRWLFVGCSLVIRWLFGWLYASQLFSVSMVYSLVVLLVISHVLSSFLSDVLICISVSHVVSERDFLHVISCHGSTVFHLHFFSL